MQKHHPIRTDPRKIHSTVEKVTAQNVGEPELLKLPDKLIVTADAIRTRAFQMWEQAGTPHNNGVTYWLDAERELTGR